SSSPMSPPVNMDLPSRGGRRLENPQIVSYREAIFMVLRFAGSSAAARPAQTTPQMHRRRGLPARNICSRPVVGRDLAALCRDCPDQLETRYKQSRYMRRYVAACSSAAHRCLDDPRDAADMCASHSFGCLQCETTCRKRAVTGPGNSSV